MGEALRLIVALAAWEQVRELLLVSASVTSATMLWLIWRAMNRRRMASYAAVLDAQLDECTYALLLSVRNGSEAALVVHTITVGSSWSLKHDSDGPAKSALPPREGWARIVEVGKSLSINECWETKLVVRRTDHRSPSRMSVRLDVRVCDRRIRRKRKKVAVLLSREARADNSLSSV